MREWESRWQGHVTCGCVFGVGVGVGVCSVLRKKRRFAVSHPILTFSDFSSYDIKTHFTFTLCFYSSLCISDYFLPFSFPSHLHNIYSFPLDLFNVIVVHLWTPCSYVVDIWNYFGFCNLNCIKNQSEYSVD